MQKRIRRILIGLCAAPMVIGLMPRTTKQNMKGAASAKTEHLRGTVVFVEGNRLVVKMSTGDLRTFEVPDERRFIIDGKELKVNELEPGTKLAATVTTTTTPVTERTTTVGTGKVWYVAGNNVILTLPNNENRMYKVNENYRFMVNGQKASVHDLRKGMTIAAEKIVEEPRTEVASDVAVTGSAPPRPQPVRTEVARAPEPKPRPAPVVTHAPAPAPPPATAPEPAPIETEPAPAELPKTGSPVPLFGLAGVFLMGASLVLRSSRGMF
jgi:LPXTG-motif cell wall-anchored protein